MAQHFAFRLHHLKYAYNRAHIPIRVYKMIKHRIADAFHRCILSVLDTSRLNMNFRSLSTLESTLVRLLRSLSCCTQRMQLIPTDMWPRMTTTQPSAALGVFPLKALAVL